MSAVSLIMAHRIMIGNENKSEYPVAVLGRGDTLTAHLLRKLTGYPVVELTPCEVIMGGDERRYRAVVVENFDHFDRRTLSGCAVARWELACRTGVTVVGLDDGDGQRLAAAAPGPVFSYSDGQPRANLTAEHVRLKENRLEFEALNDRELLRVRGGVGDRPRLYDHLAALAGALAVGVPLDVAVARLAETD